MHVQQGEMFVVLLPISGEKAQQAKDSCTLELLLKLVHQTSTYFLYVAFAICYL